MEFPRPELRDKTITVFHDESTFQANEDQPTLWAQKGTSVMRPKSKGSGIMVSDLIDERNDLSDEEYEHVKQKDPLIKKYTHPLLEYGEGNDGYWTLQRFVDQLKEASKIAEAKYPKEEGWRIVWVFDHSSCHAGMPDDVLDVNKNPGGAQRDGWWAGKPQKMNFSIGVPKGMCTVLEERGINTRVMNAYQLRGPFVHINKYWVAVA